MRIVPRTHDESNLGIRPLLPIRRQHRNKRFLRYLHQADLLHFRLAFLLLVEEFSLAGDVAAVAFGGHILGVEKVGVEKG